MSRATKTLDYRTPTLPTPEAVGPAHAGKLASAMVAVALLVVFLLAGPNTFHVIGTVLTDGLVPLIDVLAATLAGMAIVRRIVPGLGRPLLIASGAGVGVGLLLTAGLLMGLAGLLNAGTAWLLIGLLALGAIDLYLDQSRWRRPATNPPSDHSSLITHHFALRWLWLLAAVPLAVALAGATLPPGILWGDEPHGYDVLSYHLQVPREWYEAGRIVPLEHSVFSHFPLGQETLSLLLMHQMGGPWNAMYAAQLLSLLLMVLATMAVVGAVSQFADGYPKAAEGALASRIRDSHEGAEPVSHAFLAPADAAVAPIIAGVLFATLPWTAMLGSIAYNEALLLLATALAAAWMLRALGGDWRSALFAGLFVGLGIASKYPAVPMLAVAGVGALAVVLPWHKGARPCEMELLAFVGGAAVFALPWLLRNFAWSGNPVFPLATGLLGDGGWDAVFVERWHRAHAISPNQTRLGQFVGDLTLNPRYAYLLWPATMAAGAMLAARRDRRGVLLGLWLGAMLAIWLLFTHLQGRFLVVAAPIAVTMVGLAVTPRLRFAGVIGALLVAAASFGYMVPAARERMELARSPDLSLFGFRNVAQLTAIEDPARVRGKDVYLVGDARAFLYPVDRLHYKVVFNVPPTQGALRAWLGEALDAAPDDALVVIDPAEVDRLHRTYGTPPLEIPAPQGGVLTMRQVRQLLPTTSPATQPVQ